MTLILGIVAVAFGAVGWVGQGISSISFPFAQRHGLQEKSATADALCLGAERTAAIWDSLVLWTLPVAGILMILDNPWWPYAALVAGGIHLDAGGREAAKHHALRTHGVRVGDASDKLKAAGAYASLVVIGLLMVIWASWTLISMGR